MYVINFEIGDWSRDGHNQSEKFNIESNKPVEELREAHFLCKEKHGFDIGDICSKYKDNDASIFYNELKEIGIDLAEYAEKEELDEEYEYGDETAFKFYTPQGIARLWIDILMKIDLA